MVGTILGAEVAAFDEGLHAGTFPDQKELPELRPEDQPLDLMYKKGRGKGKGKRGPPQGGGKGRDYSAGAQASKGQSNGKFCKHCLTKNHDESECRKKAAGMSQSDARKTRPARSFEHAHEQVSLISGQPPAPQSDCVEHMADRDAGYLSRDREVYTLDFDLDASVFQGDEWFEEQEELPTGAVENIVVQMQRGLIPHF